MDDSSSYMVYYSFYIDLCSFFCLPFIYLLLFIFFLCFGGVHVTVASVIRQHLQRTSSLKLVGQFQLNFICRLQAMEER